MLRCAAVIAVIALAAGCAKEMAPQSDYGFVQFRLIKSGSFATTKANNNVLDSLYEASKIKITLRSESNETLTPTVPVMETEASLAEYGLQSEKFQLVKGNYTIIGYTVYDVLDKPITSGVPAESTTIAVIPGGLVVQDLSIATQERGFVKFRLVTKNDEELDNIDQELDGREEEIRNSASKAAALGNPANDGAYSHPFHSIYAVDIKVKNIQSNQEFTFNRLKTTHEFIESQDGNNVSSVCSIDTLVPVIAGTYKVIYLKTYFDKSYAVYEENYDVPENEFKVKDNQVTGLGEDATDEDLKTADVPVILHATAGYLQDAVALRKIWLDHDGPHWKEKGFPVIWNFDADVNVWLAQPGVQILEDGRVALLDLEGTGISGKLSPEIGKLTALRQLYMGSHTFVPGNTSGTASRSGIYDPEQLRKEKEAHSFERTFYGNQHPLVNAFRNSPYLLESFENDRNIDLRLDEPAVGEWPSESGSKYYSCQITELPDEINNLVNLEALYIAYGAMKKLPEDMSGMANLTDVEIFNCYDMTEFPEGLATLPKLISLTFSCNYKVPASETENGLEAINGGNAAKSLQLLYLPNQKMTMVPDLTNIMNLGLLNIQNCGVESFEKPFGKDHPFAQFLASYNKITNDGLPKDAEGYFMGMSSETETITFANNNLTAVPNIFSASSVYIMGTIDFSYNQITDVEDGDGYRGVKCRILNLAGNDLTTLPKQILGSGSYIEYMQLQQNGITEITEEALEGENTHWVSAWDLSYNKLNKLPDNFNSRTLQYMSGLDLSYNRFDKFPYTAVNSQYLLTFIFRGQRDENGNRCMREWPSGIGDNLFRLRALYLGSNDIGKITDKISYLCYNLDISDNPNISVDITHLCPYIKAGMFNLIYSPGQDIRGCDDGLILD